MSKDVTAIYENATQAGIAVERLLAIGVSEQDISVLMSEATQGRELKLVERSKAPEGAAAGGAIGGTIGAVAAALGAAGTLAIPGVGWVAGPLVAALAGLGAGAGTGGLVGALVGAGIPEHEAKLATKHVDEGGILLAAHVHEDRRKQVEEVLRNAGGAHVHVA